MARLGEWATVFGAYAGIVNNQLVEGLTDAENTESVHVSNNVSNNAQLTEDKVKASQALYCVLVLLVRGESLNIVVKYGARVGLLSWRRLV